MSEPASHSRPVEFSDTFLIRSFQASDRPQILLLHEAVAPDSVDCDCAMKIDQIEEQYFRRPQDHFWVADARGQILGTIAMCVHESDVAHLHCLRAIDDSNDYLIRKGLVQAAASHARDHGCIKLVIHAQVADVQRTADFMRRLGFRFSRHRDIQNHPILEFYLNLYERPQRDPPRATTSPHPIAASTATNPTTSA